VSRKFLIEESGEMKRMLLVALVACLAGVSLRADDDKPKYTIKEAMKFHKEKLHEKFQKGQATKEETQTLLDAYISMGKQKPPKGDEKSWKEKNDALIKAVKDDNKEAFAKAVNCGGCHGAHK
jgi:hypothetical protein